MQPMERWTPGMLRASTNSSGVRLPSPSLSLVLLGPRTICGAYGVYRDDAELYEG